MDLKNGIFEEKKISNVENKLSKGHLKLNELEPRRNKLFQDRNRLRSVADTWGNVGQIFKT